MTKRLTSLVLALCLALGALLTPAYAAAGAPRGGAGISTTLRVEGYGFTAVEPTAVTLPDTYKSLPEYGLTAWADKDPGFYTPLHVLAQYCVDNGLDPGANLGRGQLRVIEHPGDRRRRNAGQLGNIPDI